MVTRQERALDAGADPRVGLASVIAVRLVGRLSMAVVDREMSSGDVLATFRVVVDRMESADGGQRVRVDAIDCHTWSTRLRRQVADWQLGDVVELDGALRRRFFRAGAATQSLTEVEVVRGRVVRRSGAG